MRKFCIIAVLMVLTGLSGCRGKADYALTGFIFDRGHGSAWGNQLYMEVRSTEIVVLNYISKETNQLETLERIPIQPEQWEALKTVLLNLKLQKDSLSWKEWLFKHNKLDGGEYRKLSLIYSGDGEETETKYRWPGNAAAQELEEMLEQLVRSVTEAAADAVHHTGEFAVLIPDGWSAVPEKDPFSDPPNAEKTNCLSIIKGGTTEQDLHSNLYVRLNYYKPGEAVPEPPTETCKNIEEMEPLALGQYTWYGFTADELQGRAVLGKVAVLWTDTDEGNFVASCWLERAREKITLDDEQLQAILKSVTPMS